MPIFLDCLCDSSLAPCSLRAAAVARGAGNPPFRIISTLNPSLGKIQRAGDAAHCRTLGLGCLVLLFSGYSIQTQPPVHCMPPRRQTKVWTEAPPDSQTGVSNIPGLRRGPPPLNEGFARTPTGQGGQVQANAPAASSSSFEPPRSDGQAVQAYARGSKRVALEVASDPDALLEATEQLKACA